MQVPMAPSAVQGAAGGGALAQPAAQPAPAPVVAPATVATPAPAVATATAPAPVAGGGPVDINAIVAALQQLVPVLTNLVATLQAQLPQAQAQAGAAGVQGGGGSTVAGDAGSGAATDPSATGGGSGVVQQAPSGGCGCGGSVAQGGGAAVQQASDEPAQSTAPAQQAPPAPPAPPAGAGDGKLNSGDLTVKGAKMNDEQRRLAEIVLQTGKEMGANKKVLETAVSTMIQAAVIKNDSSVDGKDHDSLGLFQQRPSQGWGTREQISNPEYAARKFFEKAIPNDQKNPGLAKTRLAQSVQISAYPDAYAKWDSEAEKIVADFLG
jgi:hypothetical protein